MLLRLTISTACLAVALAAPGAYAFTVDEGGNNAATAKLADPDNKIPFPHLDDKGQPAHAAEGSGLHFDITGPSASQDNGPDAFQRAQQRMGQ